MKKQKNTKTDFQRLKKMSDKEIDYSDIPTTTQDFWDDAEVVMPVPKEHVSLRLDADIIHFFKKDGRGYQSKINAVLKSYVSAHSKRKKKVS